MSQLNALIARFSQDEEGQGLAEYALILALIAIVAIVALIFLGGQISSDPPPGRDFGLTTGTTQPRDRRPLPAVFWCPSVRRLAGVLPHRVRSAPVDTTPDGRYVPNSAALRRELRRKEVPPT